MKEQNNQPRLKRRGKEYRQYLQDTIGAFDREKKTVLLVCDAFFPVMDGVVSVMDNYARRLCKRMNVLVLAPACRGEVYLKSYPVLGTASAYSKKLNYMVPLPAFDGLIKKVLGRMHIDLIHCHSPFFLGNYVLKLSRKRHIPLVMTFHSQYKQDFTHYVGDGAINRFLMRYIMKAFNGADEVWTMNPASGEVLRSYGYQKYPRIIPHAIAFAPPEDYEEERKKGRSLYGDGVPLLIFVGRLVEQKNIFFLAEVLGELKRRGVPFRMVFAGEGPDRDRLEELLRREDVWEDTLFTGQLHGIQNLELLYAAADLQLFPSRYDTFGLVKIEAASRYTPTVFAEGSVASSDVENGVNGYVLPEDITAFADGVANILTNADTLVQTGKNAYRDLFVTWEDVMDRVVLAYEDVLKQYSGK